LLGSKARVAISQLREEANFNQEIILATFYLTIQSAMGNTIEA
jgi:hypothetical protein